MNIIGFNYITNTIEYMRITNNSRSLYISYSILIRILNNSVRC